MSDIHYPPSPIRAILDSSAVQSYGRGHIHVGEVISEIAKDKARVGIPAVALLDASAEFLTDGVARARLGVLTALPNATVLDLDTDAAVAVADVVPYAGDDLARAHAAWAALEHSALLLTTELGKSVQAVAEDRILVIPTEDA
jgi:hypothetical protein